MDIEILHLENNFVAVVKPNGVLSEKSDANTPGMVDLLREKIGGEIYPVHRLDREAGGVMIYARTNQGATKLSSLVASPDGFEKQYIIVVHGCPENDSGIFEDLLFKDSRKNKSFVVQRERKGVKKASLEYRVLKKTEYKGQAITLVRVKLHTGRTHQIRVQFSSRKMPVVGDLRYGSAVKTEMCLFSEKISFINPFSCEKVCYESKPCGNIWDIFEK